ncbi:MAG: hypothetical protein AB7K68_11950 [Bacteriovoracia bacterium]
MSKFTIFFFLLTAAAQAGEVKTDVLFPLYQARPILSLLSSEQKESPDVQVGLMMSRATRICEFLSQPPGSFRSRRAENLLTKRFAHDGKMAALEKQSNGKINPRLLEIAKTEHPEVVKSLRCVGSR